MTSRNFIIRLKDDRIIQASSFVAALNEYILSRGLGEVNLDFIRASNPAVGGSAEETVLEALFNAEIKVERERDRNADGLRPRPGGNWKEVVSGTLEMPVDFQYSDQVEEIYFDAGGWSPVV